MATLQARIDLPLRSFALDLSLDVERTVALVGPSGAGKTTVLRAIAGLVRPRGGRVALGDDVWFEAEGRVNRRPDERSVGLVFQEYALFPHMSVRANVAYGGTARADEFLDRFGIAHLAAARPTELSGGERQRVALARALARNPGVLLLDEPLAALDAHTRTTVRMELRTLLRELALPTILVTHDFDDATALADEVGVIVDGRLRQLAPAQELVARPADSFVASFTGANVLRGVAERRDGGLTAIRLESGHEIFSADDAEGEVSVAVYPWEVTVGRERHPDSALNHIVGDVRSLVHVGTRVRVQVGPVVAEVTASSADRLELETGGLAFASFKATGTRLLGARPPRRA